MTGASPHDRGRRLGAISAVDRYTAFGLVLASRIPLPLLRRASGREAFRIRLARTAPQVDVVHEAWPEDDEDGVPTFLGRNGRYVAAVVPDQIQLRIRPDGRLISLTPLRTLSSELLAHLALDFAVPLAIGLGPRLALHAASVAIDGQVVAVLGPTRAGKSTLAAAVAREGGRLVADDCTVVELSPDGLPFAIPSYGYVRLWGPSLRMLGVDAHAGAVAWPGTLKRSVSADSLGIVVASGPQRLRSIVVLDLDAGPGPSLVPLAAREVAIELLGAAFRLVVDEPERGAAEFVRAAAVAEHVSGWRLYLPDNPSVLPAAARLVRSAANGAA